MRGAVRQRPFGSPAADLGDRQQVDTVILAVDHEGQVFMDGVVAVAGHGSALLAHQNSAHSSPPAFGAAARAGRTGLLATGFCVRSEEHTSELQSLMRISYAVFCLKKKKQDK